MDRKHLEQIARATVHMARIHAALFSRLAGLKALARLTGQHRTSVYRHAFSHLQTEYGSRLLEGLCRDLDIPLSFTFEGFDDPSRPRSAGPLLVVSNHQSTIDIVVLYAVMRRLNHTRVRWVMKDDLDRPYNPYGWAGREMGDAFVGRKGDSADLFRIRSCAVQAAEEDAALLIFPEGTRFKGPADGSSLTRVLPPRFKGFNVACDTMPSANVLSVTLRWSGGADGLGFGRTFTDMEGLIGRKLSVHAKLVPRSIVDPNRKGWLDEEWRQKDEMLATLEDVA